MQDFSSYNRNKDLLLPKAEIPWILYIILGNRHVTVQCSTSWGYNILFLLLNTTASCTYCFSTPSTNFPSLYLTEFFWSFGS